MYLDWGVSDCDCDIPGLGKLISMRVDNLEYWNGSSSVENWLAVTSRKGHSICITWDVLNCGDKGEENFTFETC